ncbi:hypothetical protein U1Q18_023460 [Sarracenia purpurea var. burkii]
MVFLYSLTSLVFSISIVLLFITLLLISQILNEKKKKYHPIGGTVFHQLFNFNRLYDYMTDLAAKHKTYRLIGPFRTEVYTSDPANVEYILKTNFHNFGKDMAEGGRQERHGCASGCADFGTL